MGISSDVTLCLTAGGRPDLLERTLRSLFAAEPQDRFSAIIIANDLGDHATSDVAKKLCPQATILHHSWQRGQHATIDEMYSLVSTPLIFHCEDDWEFTEQPFLALCRDVLEKYPQTTVACVRSVGASKGNGNDELVSLEHGKAIFPGIAGRDEWASFTFNPSLLQKELWETLGGYSGFNAERDIDRHFRSVGRHRAHVEPGGCVHTGDNRHVINPFYRKGGTLRDGFRVAKYRAIHVGKKLVGQG